MPVEAVSKPYEVVKSHSKLASILQWVAAMALHGVLGIARLAPFHVQPCQNVRKLLTRWLTVTTLLSTLRPSWHIIGLLWRSWIFQKCADYTTRSFTHLMISNRGFHDAQFMYCPTHCPHRRPTEVQPRTYRGYPLQTPHRMCTRDADRMPLGACTP
jgi:hypothetical protein